MFAPGEQVPVKHTPMSPQAVPFRTLCAQPVAGAQESPVHGLPSSQLTAVPPHMPPAHLSGLVHWLLSSHPAALLVVLQPNAMSQ